jgi:hypothetical protein
VIALLKHLQHAPGRTVIFVGILERVVDDLNREHWQPQMEGGKAARMVDAPGVGGRPVRQEQAQGILIAVLGVLAAHFGYGRPSGLQEACATLDDRFRIEEQRSEVATVMAAREPIAAVDGCPIRREVLRYGL